MSVPKIELGATAVSVDDVEDDRPLETELRRFPELIREQARRLYD